MSRPNYFNDIINNQEYFYDLPDCISSCEDYKELIEKSFQLTNGKLTLEAFSCKNQEGKYFLEITVNDTHQAIVVDQISDYADGKNLVQGLNQILIAVLPSTDRRFCEAGGGSVDFGIAFIPPAKEYELAKSGLIWRPATFFAEYESAIFTEQARANQSTKPSNQKPSTKPWWKFW